MVYTIRASLNYWFVGW